MKIQLPHYVKYPVAVRTCKMIAAVYEDEKFDLGESQDGKFYIIADRNHLDEITKLARELHSRQMPEDKKPLVQRYQPKYKSRFR